MDYDNLGSHYYSLGDVHKDIEFSEKPILNPPMDLFIQR